METLKRVLSWAQRNERHLGAVLFVFGFGGDIFTFAYLSVGLANLAFIAYLVSAAVCTLGSHLFSASREHSTVWRRTLSVLFPLGAQFAIGSLLSGCLIFYTKSSALLVSWPFLLLLVVVFIGNEYFRTYYKHLAFQNVLLFFAIYAYAIFAVPLYLKQLGPWIFALSTAISIVLFALFLLLQARLGRDGFLSSLRYVVPGTLLITLLMCVSYFTGLIPPIPLSLPSSGIFYSVHRESGNYVVALENDHRWWDLRPQVIHHYSGTPLYAFSSVAAPFQFATSVVHEWEHYDPTSKSWTTQSRVSFPITGGRDGGYRGYSAVSDPEAGKWRVSIETPSGQVIGRIYFTVETVDTPPLIKEETR